MSRVITRQPVLIARNQASRQNLVESTKLGRITIDSIKTQRIQKKETKEKRKHKTDKSFKHSSRKASDVVGLKQHFLSSKKLSDESDHLEKSGLTEELEEPQNHLGYLSDGRQNSKKRKREKSPPAVESPIQAAPVAGNPLRIRLIFKKPKTEVPVLSREDLVCSNTVAKSLGHQDVITTSGSKISELEENLPSTSRSVIAETKKIKKHRPSKEDRYNALFDDWTTPSICFAHDSCSKDDDDEWLFGNKTQKMLNTKAEAVKIDEVMNMRLGDSSWPRAQFLPEVGIHSLPYTVPF